MLKNKKLLLTILLTLVAIILLQAQVKAEDFDFFSTYDYALTDTGVIAKDDLTGDETIIATIKGEYTGEITKVSGENTIKICNFSAIKLDFDSSIYKLYIEGENSVILYDSGEYRFGIYDIEGNGKLRYQGIGVDYNIKGLPYGYTELSEPIESGYNNLPFRCEIYVGDFIRNLITDQNASSKNVIYPECDYIDWSLTEDLLKGGVRNISLIDCNIQEIPNTVFKELSKTVDGSIIIEEYFGGYAFLASNVTNTNVNFTLGIKTSNEPLLDMVDTKKEDVVYINFSHSGQVPGSMIIGAYNETFKENDILKCYYFNEETKMYQRVEDAKMINDYFNFQLNITQGGKYVVSKTELPAELVENHNNEDIDKKWCNETEVDSLVWTEEDINKILADIEETRNNTTDKQLYVHVPSGSKVPAKIFEAAKGIDISIISEDGIWAEFSGGDYKAIDYVAGGTISNKVIDGMVNVGEDTIVYLSLKHEGQLPAKCYISYFQGRTEIGLGGDVNTVKTKLYYFNKDVQKYELCGTGYMDLACDLYVFELEHCSSYVMSEEALPDEFVIKNTTGEDSKKEEPKKEEPKKEETKQEDTTKAPGSLPHTGGTFVIIVSVLAIIALGIYAYRRNNDLKGI